MKGNKFINIIIFLFILLSLCFCKKTPLEEPKYIFVHWANNLLSVDTFSAVGHDTSFLEEQRRCFILMIDPNNKDTNSNKYYQRTRNLK